MRERRPSVNRVHESRNATKPVFLSKRQNSVGGSIPVIWNVDDGGAVFVVAE